MNQVMHLSRLIRLVPRVKLSVRNSRSFLTESYQSLYSSVFAPGCLSVDAICHSMHWVHNSCQLPWWATVVLTSLLLRSVVVTPLHIYTVVTSHKREKYMRSEAYKQSEQQMKNEAMLKSLRKSEGMKAYRQDIALKKMILHKETMGKYPLYSGRSMLVQLPLWMSTSFSLRNMCGHRGVMEPENAVLGLSSGGFGSFYNLLEMDPALSFLFLTLNVVNVEISAAQSEDSKVLTFVRYLSLGGTGVIFASSFFMPAVLPLYWCVSSGHQIATRLIFMSPRVLKLLNIESSSKSPYRDLFNALKWKYSFQAKLSK